MQIKGHINRIVSRETHKTEYGNKQDKELLNTLFHAKHIEISY